MGMAVPESMVRMTFSSTEPEYLVEFSQDELDELALIAFLKTLTDTSFINNPVFRDPH